MINAIAYMRLSADERHTGSISFDVQAENIKRLAETLASKEGASVNLVESVEDNAISGAVPFKKRPGGRRVEALIASKSINAIFALRQERLFRDTKEALEYVDQWVRQGVAVYFAEDGGSVLDASSPSGRLVFTIKAAAASFEREQTSVRVRENKASRKMQGKTYSAPRYGFDHIDGYEVPNPDEQEVIRRIVAMRKCGFSLRQISTVLMEERHPTKTGKVFWSAQIVSDLIKRHLSDIPLAKDQTDPIPPDEEVF